MAANGLHIVDAGQVDALDARQRRLGAYRTQRDQRQVDRAAFARLLTGGNQQVRLAGTLRARQVDPLRAGPRGKVAHGDEHRLIVPGVEGIEPLAGGKPQTERDLRRTHDAAGPDGGGSPAAADTTGAAATDGAAGAP